LYEETKNQTWLDRACFAANYEETFQIIQDMDMDPIGATGEERDFRHDHPVSIACHGNKVRPIGLSHVGTGPGSDIYNAYCVPDYYRLHQYTKDPHYLDFARMLQYNSLLYFNLGDKTGGMADRLHHTGIGFINEFISTGASNDKYIPGRGWANDGNIAWCSYVLLSGQHRLKQITGSYVLM
jgi:hypothetical protein